MDPWNPILQAVNSGSEPFARPFRRFLPRKRYGQFDWAPVFALAVLIAIYYVFTALAMPYLASTI
jgi:uncharacterized protein YggT (Ycf19 family)